MDDHGIECVCDDCQEAPATEGPAEVLTTRAPAPAMEALASAGSVVGRCWCVACERWMLNAWPCEHMRAADAALEGP